MRIKVTTEGQKFSDLFRELDQLEGDLGEAALSGAQYMAQVSESAIRQQYGKSGDFVADSIGYNVEKGEDGKSAVGSVGVFKVDHIAGKHGRLKQVGGGEGSVGFADPSKAVPAPVVAWWIEYGTVWQPARPFLESGWLMASGARDQAFRDAFNKVIDKARRNG